MDAAQAHRRRKVDVPLTGGTLVVRFPAAQVPAVGAVVPLLTATRLAGTFTSINVEGRKVTPIYSPTGLSVRIDG